MTPLRDHLEKTSILIVDDSPLNRAAYSTVLGGKGYRITEASSGAEALERAGKEDFSVILLDVRMPGMDGFETARQLRQREETKYTPILFVSAFDQSQFQVFRGYPSGATDYMFSPVTPAFLIFKVEAFVYLRLRNEHLKDQIVLLNRVIEGLQKEVEHWKEEAEAIKKEIRNLRQVVVELQRELSGVALS
ncbi:MAG TPA: response regulator [Planctomycetota bacterium]|nr:response regulator [Planctomycetota bacterium]